MVTCHPIFMIIYMKTLNKIFFWAILTLSLVACNEDQKLPNGYIETTQNDASTLVLKGYNNSSEGFSVFKPSGFSSPFYIENKAFSGKAYSFIEASEKRLDAMTVVPIDGNWQATVAIVPNSAYWARYAEATVFRYIKFHVAYIDGNNVGIEYVISENTTVRPNINSNEAFMETYPLAVNLEMPFMSTQNTFVAHTLTVGSSEVLNYAYEWNATMKHAEWVAFSFDETTCKDVTGRTDTWDVDPLLPANLQTSNTNHTNDGFDRGHICASEDRVWSVAANKQTFYFSNISPQLASFNQGFWVGVENQVRQWGRAVPKTYDKVYVTKGGTLNHLLKNFTGSVVGGDGKYPTTDENGFTIKGLACPQYYFVAVLSEKNGVYNAIGFLVEHNEGLPKNPTAAELQQYIVSIDELEAFSGIDFFCNLPDDLENEVESSYNAENWVW